MSSDISLFDTGCVVDLSAIGEKFNAFIPSVFFFTFLFPSYSLFAFDLNGNENQIIQELCIYHQKEKAREILRAINQQNKTSSDGNKCQ